METRLAGFERVAAVYLGGTLDCGGWDLDQAMGSLC